MTAYDFTKADIAMWAKEKSRLIDESKWQEYEAQILQKHPNIRNGSDYEDADSTFIELTMSCDKEEAEIWMRAWIQDAIAYGIETQSLDWQDKFLAAYDIYKSLI